MKKKLKYSELEKALADCEAELAKCEVALYNMTDAFLDMEIKRDNSVKLLEVVASKIDEL